MRSGRTTRAPRRVPWILVGLLLAGCASPGPQAEGEPATLARLPDVHGLAVDPERPDRLLVATHEGLVRFEGGAWTRASAEPLDLMGYAQHPSDGDVAWASGHPPEGGALGIVKTTDGGATWEFLAQPNKDYHALAVSPADPERLWGWLAGALHRSDDGGATWRVVAGGPAGVIALLGGPKDADHAFAATAMGLQRSVDGGATWTPLAPVRAYALAFAADGALLAAGDAVQRSTDGGATWTTLAAPPAPVGYLAAHPTDASTLYAATFRAGVYRSMDGGASWTALMPPSR